MFLPARRVVEVEDPLGGVAAPGLGQGTGFAGLVAGGAIERMVEQDRYCIDVLTQISAIQAALDKVALGLLDDHARHCVLEAGKNERDDRTEEMMAAVGRLLRR